MQQRWKQPFPPFGCRCRVAFHAAGRRAAARHAGEHCTDAGVRSWLVWNKPDLARSLPPPP
eukprot:5076667-Pleurochrysis_carterae.AAC.1